MRRVNTEVYIVRELYSPEGELLWRRRQRSKSFVKAFLGILRVQMAQATVALNDTGGTSRNVVANSVNMRLNAGATLTTYGIVAGTGDTAVAATDYTLETLIAHGVGADQLAYSAMTINALAVADPYVSFDMYRDLTNSSGGTITVYEYGIYVLANDGAANRTFCVVRDVISAGDTVPDGSNLRVTYEIQTST